MPKPARRTVFAAFVGGALCWSTGPLSQPQLRPHQLLKPPAWGAALLPGTRAGQPAMVMTAPTQITREGVAPAGPDPYKLVRDDIEYIKACIKKMLSTKGSGTSNLAQNEVLTMSAREFSARKGKSFRPMLVLLIGRATNPDFVTDVRHFKLAVISEMIHTASLIHGDVLEDHADVSDSSQGTLVHQEVALDVGNKVCILAGDFLLAKAAVELSLLDNSDVTELVARGLESICEGGMMEDDDEARLAGGGAALQRYLSQSTLNTAQLISNCCHCSSILSGHDVDSIVAQSCRVFGEEIAMAQQLVSEAEQIDALLKAHRRSPKSWPSSLPPTAPLLVASEEFSELRPVIARGYEQPADKAFVIEALERSGAVKHTLQMAAERAQAAAEALEVLPNSAARDALVVLCHKVLAGTPIKGK